MEIVKEIKENAVILHLEGRMNTNTAPLLEKEIKEITQTASVNLIIDYEKLEYISSAGLRVQLLALKLSQKCKGKLILCSMSSFVRNVFDLAGFTALFTITGNCEEALKEIN